MNKFKILLLFSAFLVFSGLSAQEIELPKSYERQIKRQQSKVDKLEKKYDIVLTPEESIPIPQIAVDALANKDWGLDYLFVSKYAAQIRQKSGKRKVLVVVFDTAGELPNTNFDKCRLPGLDFTGEGGKDGHGHGTHVAGTIASGNVNIGVGEVLSTDGYLKVMPVKNLHNQGFGKMDEIIKAVNKVNTIIKDYIQAGWMVIYSNSWGGGGKVDPTLNKAFEAAENMGVIIVTASGNNGTGTIGSPANSEFSEAIGAIDQNGNRASFSQYGEGLTFVAPGVLIYSEWPENKTAVLSGTSMATPHVSGVYALMASYWPDATSNELKAHFRKYATDIEPDGYDIFTGYGSTIIGKLINNAPVEGEDPDDPTDPDDPDEDIIKEMRTMTFHLDSLEIVWGIGSMEDQRPLHVSFDVDVESDLLSEVIYDRFNTFTEKFFRNRGILFGDANADMWDAAKWTVIFYEMFAGRENYKCDVKTIYFYDETGREMVRSGEGLSTKMLIEVENMPLIFTR